MRIAVLSDLHANIHALRAVLATLVDREVSNIICLGDLVGYGASPSEVIAWLRQSGVPTTMGAADARVTFDFTDRFAPREGVADRTLEWTKTVLADEDRAFLRQLNLAGRFSSPAGRVKFFHGTPEDPDERLDLRVPAADLEAFLQLQKCGVVLCGATHIPYVRRVPGGVFVNPGSVGLSLNGEPGADCAIVDLSGEDAQVELLKVPYDYHAAAFDILTWDLPEVIATVIKTGAPPR